MDNPEDAARFRETTKITYPIRRDPDKTLFARYVKEAVPWNVVIDREGRLRLSKGGSDGVDREGIATLVEQLASN